MPAAVTAPPAIHFQILMVSLRATVYPGVTMPAVPAVTEDSDELKLLFRTTFMCYDLCAE
jgi:hypothetical protein